MSRQANFRRATGGEELRRISDLILAVVGLVLLFPLFLLGIFTVLVSSGWPVLFTDQRIGYRLEKVSITKIRTMSAGANKLHSELLKKQIEESGSIYLGRECDARVTKVGRILRRSSIDEYPQLINVLRGEMGIVGPRPMLPQEVPFLSERQLKRFEIKPGLTGLAQISGRKALHSEESLGLDVHYVESRTFFLDVIILLKTPLAIFRGVGAH